MADRLSSPQYLSQSGRLLGLNRVGSEAVVELDRALRGESMDIGMVDFMRAPQSLQTVRQEGVVTPWGKADAGDVEQNQGVELRLQAAALVVAHNIMRLKAHLEEQLATKAARKSAPSTGKSLAFFVYV